MDHVRTSLSSHRKNGLLVRGMNGYGRAVGHLTIGDKRYDAAGHSYFIKSVRKERKPMDTTKIIHHIIDDWFEEEMGMKARSEAVFCFGEAARVAAKEYGELAVILPIGKFHYVWSPKIADLYDDVIRKEIQNPARMGAPSSIKPEYVGSDGKPDIEKIHELMNGLKYTINGFDKAVGDSVEIMVECDEYYVIPVVDEFQLEKIKKAFVHA